MASKVFVKYEALMREPLAQACRLAAFLDEHCGGAPSAEQSMRAMADRVNPALWRNHSDRALSEIAEATPEQRRLYGFVRSKVQEPGKAFVDAYPMPPGWREFVHNAEAAIRAHSQCAEAGEGGGQLCKTSVTEERVNNVLQPTARSVGSRLAPAFGSG